MNHSSAPQPLRRNPLRAPQRPWRNVPFGRRRLELMVTAPRRDLSADEIVELEAYLSQRRVRHRHLVMENDGIGDDEFHPALLAARVNGNDDNDIKPQIILGRDGSTQTLLITPDSDNQGLPLYIHHPFKAETSPMIIRRRQHGLRHNQADHIELTIGPDLDSFRAELHAVRPDGAREEHLAGQRVDPDGNLEHGSMANLICDPAVVLGVTLVALGFWLVWLWYLEH